MSDQDSKDEAEEKDGEPARDSAPPEEEEETRSADDDEPPRVKSGRSGKAARKARREEETRAAKKKSAIQAVGVGVLALAVGGAVGWFGHIEQAKAKIRAESAPSAAGSASGACGAWEKKICSGSGEQSAACQQAKGATGLMTTSTCEMALEAVPATLAKVKAERRPCDDLVGKLCKDLPQGSKACDMVKERTPVFPPEKCKELLKNYDQVLAEVRQIDQQPQMPMGMPGHGADDGHGH
jgi:hypothetical protein